MNNKIVIRKAEKKDLEDIQNLNKLLFDLEYKNYDSTLDTTWPVSNEGTDYFKNAIENDITIVATDENKVFGYIIGSLNTQNTYNKYKQAELDNMCILEDYRKLGIGSRLFEKFKAICKENDIKELKVVASYKNQNAINFYKKNGFEEAEITLKQRL
ncbi:MAG: GNAT family N-acetyltransferase [Clostridia bacterium]|nr:GNAT family N-acetyltransferase [Clostridia bacterium]